MREKLSKIGVNIPELSKENLKKYLEKCFPIAIATALVTALAAFKPGAAFVGWQTMIQNEENKRNAKISSEDSD